MASLADRLVTNVPGTFYVDSTCIDCGLCREIAPSVFALDEETGYSFVSRQPVTDEEKAAVREAIGSCPVEAIGEDPAA